MRNDPGRNMWLLAAMCAVATLAVMTVAGRLPIVAQEPPPAPGAQPAPGTQPAPDAQPAPGTPAELERKLARMADEMLANTVIEDYEIRVDR